jgi:hypothetical protein
VLGLNRGHGFVSPVAPSEVGESFDTSRYINLGFI